MPRGKIAGFPRPLAEGELLIESALDITDAYGEQLEGTDFRANEEDKMEQIAVDVMGGPMARDMSVELGPAGNVSGIRIATDSTKFLSRESRSRIISADDIERYLNAIPDRVQGVVGFRVPGEFIGFGEVTEEPLYSIETR